VQVVLNRSASRVKMKLSNDELGFQRGPLGVLLQPGGGQSFHAPPLSQAGGQDRLQPWCLRCPV